jgi:flagellin
MSFRIRTNTLSLNAQQNVGRSTREVQASSEKLSSGSRINKAADDAAGLAISENLRANIRSLSQAKRNANDGVSLLNVAESGLMESSNMIVRLRELAIQAASDTIGDQERGYLDQEFLQLKSEINRIASSTEYNGTLLLTGDNKVGDELTTRANSFPLEVQVGAKYFAGADALDQANPVNTIKIDFAKINGFTHGENSLSLGEGEEGARVMDKKSAQATIGMVDDAMQKLNSHRAYIGSVQNRLQSVINNLDTRVQADSETRSRITDTDFAEESATMTQATIIQKAGTSMLASANQQPQVALQLLQ